MPTGADFDDLSREDLLNLVGKQAKVIEKQATLIEELRKQIDDLRRKQARPAAPFSKGNRKSNPKRPGRKKGQGEFRRREAPVSAPETEPVDAPVNETVCPLCGGQLEQDEPEIVSNTDVPPRTEPEVHLYRIHRCHCKNSKCGAKFRGQHPDVAPDQAGATAHRVGPRVKAIGHAIHYGQGVTGRKTVQIIRELTGVGITQSALVQDGMKRVWREGGEVGNRYRQLRDRVRESPVTYTDDTGWRIKGTAAYLMVFATDRETVYQIRGQHGHEQVMEIIPADYAGKLVSDRGPSYEAAELSKVRQHKCLAHLIRNVDEVVQTKQGRARGFGVKLKKLLQRGIRLWRNHQNGKIPDMAGARKRLAKKLDHHLRHRRLRDPDNQRLLDGIGLQNDRGRILDCLSEPGVEPTNNRAERALRPAVIARKVSHCSQNERGAESFAAFTSVLQTANKTAVSATQTLYALFTGQTR